VAKCEPEVLECLGDPVMMMTVLLADVLQIYQDVHLSLLEYPGIHRCKDQLQMLLCVHYLTRQLN